MPGAYPGLLIALQWQKGGHIVGMIGAKGLYLKSAHRSLFRDGYNRGNSADSHIFGYVQRKRSVGQALAVVISLDIFNHYRPRWNRSFTRLLLDPTSKVLTIHVPGMAARNPRFSDRL